MSEETSNNRLGRFFVDLCSNPHTTEDAVEILHVLSQAGYRAVAFEYSGEINKDIIEYKARSLGLRLVWRTTIKASSRRELRSAVQSAVRRKIDLISVYPLTLEAGRYAAQHKSVHLIHVPPGMDRLVDKSTLELFRQRGWGAIEVSFKLFLASLKEPDRKMESALRFILTTFRRASGYSLPLAISSCSETKWDVAHPRHIIGLASIAGIPEEVALEWVSRVPLSVLSIASKH